MTFAMGGVPHAGPQQVAIPFCRGSSGPRDWRWVSFIAGRFFTVWATREAQRSEMLCVHHMRVYVLSSFSRVQPSRLLCLWYAPGKNAGVGCHSLLHGIFLAKDQTQVSCMAGRFFMVWATGKLLPQGRGYLFALVSPYLFFLLLVQLILLPVPHPSETMPTWNRAGPYGAVPLPRIDPCLVSSTWLLSVEKL